MPFNILQPILKGISLDKIRQGIHEPKIIDGGDGLDEFVFSAIEISEMEKSSFLGDVNNIYTRSG